VTPGPPDDDRLDQLRQIGDPEADGLAAALREGHEDLDERDIVRLVLDRLVHPDRLSTDDELGAWMFGGPPLPDWADEAKLRAGQDFFECWTLPICTALFCASLPTGYAGAKGVQVLALTSDLASGDMRRRVAETAQMLVDIMDPGPRSPATLEPGGQGHLTVRGVRLLHAVVRDAILTSPLVTHTCDESVPIRWCADWGHPINQEDLLGTLLTFTVSVLNALDKLGIPYDPEGAEGYVHVWCVVGSQLGIDPSLLPADRAEAQAMADVIYRRQHGRSIAGERLMSVLLTQMELAMPWGLRKLPRTMVRHLTRPGVADLLGVPKAAWWSPAVRSLRTVGPLIGRVPGGRALCEAPGDLLSRAMIRMFVDATMDGERPAFRLDATTARALAIHSSAARRQRRRRRVVARATRGAPAPTHHGPGAALLTGHPAPDPDAPAPGPGPDQGPGSGSGEELAS
jgi:ER-bound oxygenase mpaB/B'/Rubber oxygenase, catalytic domain